jgi:hypothetical protein
MLDLEYFFYFSTLSKIELNNNEIKGEENILAYAMVGLEPTITRPTL